jgi:hypothetical protein
MGHTPAFLYTLGLLPFGLALSSFPPSTECYKRAFLGDLHHTLYHTSTNGSDVTLAHILFMFVRLLVGNTGSPRVRGTMQATFIMESRENGSAGLIWDIGEALMVGKSRTQLRNNLLERQHTQTGASCQSKCWATV